MGVVSGPAITREIHSKLLRGLDQLPRLSPNVNRLLNALAHVDVEVREVTELVERDALLTAHILKLANSALMNCGREIISVRQAIAYLGLNTLRRAALSFTVLRVFGRLKTPPTWSFIRFNQHAAATATLAEIVAHTLPSRHEDQAFIAGLLHDIGKVVIAVALPQLFEDTAALARVSDRPLFDCEREMIGIDHAELSALALARWDFPELIRRAVQYHHTEEYQRDSELSLNAVVRIADQHVNHVGISVLGADPARAADTTVLNGCTVSLEPSFERFAAEWRQLASLFQ